MHPDRWKCGSYTGERVQGLAGRAWCSRNSRRAGARTLVVGSWSRIWQAREALCGFGGWDWCDVACELDSDLVGSTMCHDSDEPAWRAQNLLTTNVVVDAVCLTRTSSQEQDKSGISVPTQESTHCRLRSSVCFVACWPLERSLDEGPTCTGSEASKSVVTTQS